MPITTVAGSGADLIRKQQRSDYVSPHPATAFATGRRAAASRLRPNTAVIAVFILLRFGNFLRRTCNLVLDSFFGRADVALCQRASERMQRTDYAAMRCGWPANKLHGQLADTCCIKAERDRTLMVLSHASRLRFISRSLAVLLHIIRRRFLVMPAQCWTARALSASTNNFLPRRRACQSFRNFTPRLRHEKSLTRVAVFALNRNIQDTIAPSQERTIYVAKGEEGWCRGKIPSKLFRLRL